MEGGGERSSYGAWGGGMDPGSGGRKEPLRGSTRREVFQDEGAAYAKILRWEQVHSAGGTGRGATGRGRAGSRRGPRSWTPGHRTP